MQFVISRLVLSKLTPRRNRLQRIGHRAGVHPAIHLPFLRLEARIPFELVHERLRDEAQLRRFKTLILPNVVALSDAQCRQLEQFAEHGGSVIATHETSLRDEWGVKRSDFGLTQLFGVSFGGQIEPRMQNAYLRLEHETCANHPLLRGLEDAPRIIHGTALDWDRPEFAPAMLTGSPSGAPRPSPREASGAGA